MEWLIYFHKAIFKATKLLEVEISWGNLSYLLLMLFTAHYYGCSLICVLISDWAKIFLCELGICLEANIKILTPDRNCTEVTLSRDVDHNLFSHYFSQWFLFSARSCMSFSKFCFIIGRCWILRCDLASKPTRQTLHCVWVVQKTVKATKC